MQEKKIFPTFGASGGAEAYCSGEKHGCRFRFCNAALSPIRWANKKQGVGRPAPGSDSPLLSCPTPELNNSCRNGVCQTPLPNRSSGITFSSLHRSGGSASVGDPRLLPGKKLASHCLDCEAVHEERLWPSGARTCGGIKKGRTREAAAPS